LKLGKHTQQGIKPFSGLPDRISFPFGLGAISVRGEAYVLRKINEI
jgi:hypothetical protein